MITEKQRKSIVESLKKEETIKEFFFYGNQPSGEKPKEPLRPNLKSELFDILTVQLGIDDKKLVSQILKSCNMERANRFVERIKSSFGLK